MPKNAKHAKTLEAILALCAEDGVTGKALLREHRASSWAGSPPVGGYRAKAQGKSLNAWIAEVVERQAKAVIAMQ